MINLIYQGLSGLGFNHPLHPAITHIPMGMVMGGFMFAIVSLIIKKNDLAQAAHYCFTLALIFVGPTMILGYMDWQYKFDGEWGNIIIGKMIMALVFTGALGYAYMVGKNPTTDIKKKIVVYGICLAIATSLGFMGGELQYG